MHPALRKCSFALLALSLGLLLAPQARSELATGSRIPPEQQKKFEVTKEDFKNPAIVKPDDPGTTNPCYGYSDNKDNQALHDADNRLGRGTPSQYGNRCLPQQDSFKNAAEAASYLAIYQSQYSAFGSRMQDKDALKDAQDSIRKCVVENAPADSKECQVTLGALVQYNFGKELKAQMIENQSRAKRMESLDFRTSREKDLRGRPTRIVSSYGIGNPKMPPASGAPLRSGTLRKNTFRLDPTKVAQELVDPDAYNEMDRRKLGADFNRDFQQFVTEYTHTSTPYGPKSRWHYAPVRSSAVGADGVYIAKFDPNNRSEREGRSMIRQDRLQEDIRTQDNNRKVQEIVQTFQDHFRDVVKNSDEVVNSKTADGKDGEPKKINSMRAATQVMGFGMPLDKIDKDNPDAPKSPQDLAALVVVNIDKKIYLKEKEMRGEKDDDDRFPSSIGAEKARRSSMAASVTLDVHEFDLFLDQIWPPGVDKPAPVAQAPTLAPQAIH